MLSDRHSFTLSSMNYLRYIVWIKGGKYDYLKKIWIYGSLWLSGGGSQLEDGRFWTETRRVLGMVDGTHHSTIAVCTSKCKGSWNWICPLHYIRGYTKVNTIYDIPYALHYNPRFVAFFLKFWPYVWLVFKSGY